MYIWSVNYNSKQKTRWKNILKSKFNLPSKYLNFTKWEAVATIKKSPKIPKPNFTFIFDQTVTTIVTQHYSEFPTVNLFEGGHQANILQ